MNFGQCLSGMMLTLLDNSNSIPSLRMKNRIDMRFLDSAFALSKDEISANSRVKMYRDKDGNFIPYELMCCSRLVFMQDGVELNEQREDALRELAYREAAGELFGGFAPRKGYKPAPPTKEELLDASRRRAKRKIFDYCICNDFDIFITLTLDRKQIDRGDYAAVIKKVNTFLSNRVQRKGLKYIGVAEYHKNGGLHFHFAATSNAFKLVDSGTVSVEGRKQPIKKSTADRLGIPEDQRHTVYNIADWRLGFSTAIYTYGERGALATYLSKELCKDVQKDLVASGSIDKIGGRWYYHSSNLDTPHVVLCNHNYNDMLGFSYECSTDGGDFKVYKFDSNGVILP